MARLSAEQALEVLEKPKNKNLIAKAIEHERRIRLHANAVKSVTDFKTEHQEFLLWVKSILHPDKYKAFEKIFRPPFPTNSLLKTVYTEYGRVFKGDNFYVKFQFKNPDLRADAEEVRESLDDKTFFETEGFNALKKRISSILVVDLPEVQKADSLNRPHPYFYLLEVDRLIDISATKTRITGDDNRQYHKIEYLAFEEGEKNCAVFCDEYYRMFEKKKGGGYRLISEKAHSTFDDNGDVIDGPARCPAQFFWNVTEDEDNFLVKDSPITSSLSDLDWLLAWSYFEKMYDLYGPFPVFVGATEKCDYQNEQMQPCTGGFTTYTEEESGKQYQKVCPSCSTSKHVGPGTFVEKPVADGVTEREMQKPFEIIAPPVENLTYVGEKTKALKDEIFLNCVGKASDLVNNQAKNETQIEGQFESKENVLWEIKTQFEIIHSFALEVWGKLRYGQQFEGVNVSYGDKFYLKDELILLEEIAATKSANMPEWELSNQVDEYILTKYRNNPDDLQRAIILRHLEPFQGKNLQDVLTMMTDFFLPVDPNELMLKSRFMDLIAMFEREYMPVHLFAEGKETHKAVTEIKTILINYINENFRTEIIRPDGEDGATQTGAAPQGRNQNNRQSR